VANGDNESGSPPSPKPGGRKSPFGIFATQPALALVLIAVVVVVPVAVGGVLWEGPSGGGGSARPSLPGLHPPSPQFSRAAPSRDCGQVEGLKLEVYGDVPCHEARTVALLYDLDGAKITEISGWTCETGTAATRPIVFTCLQGDRQFVAMGGETRSGD